jgi:hypothetical protein
VQRPRASGVQTYRRSTLSRAAKYDPVEPEKPMRVK